MILSCIAAKCDKFLHAAYEPGKKCIKMSKVFLFSLKLVIPYATVPLMGSKLLLLLVAMGIVLTVGMSVKKYNYDHDTLYTPWQIVHEKVYSFISSQ